MISGVIRAFGNLHSRNLEVRCGQHVGREDLVPLKLYYSQEVYHIFHMFHGNKTPSRVALFSKDKSEHNKTSNF
jgi:hypothetical protein